MRSMTDENCGAESNGVIKEQLSPDSSPSASRIGAPARIGSEENSSKVETAEEIPLLNSEPHAIAIRLNAKEERVRRRNRRNKLRVYLP